MKNKVAFFLIAMSLPLLSSDFCNGQTIVASTGSRDNATAITSSQAYGVSWTQSLEFTGVSISIDVVGAPGSLGTAYLTTQLGPGTTISNEVISASFSFPTVASDLTLFSGLTLGPGTYYLSIIANSGVGQWYGTSSSSVQTNAAASFVGTYGFFSPPESYLPATTPYLDGNANPPLFTVTSVPEPSTIALGVLGFGALLMVRRRSKAKEGRGY